MLRFIEQLRQWLEQSEQQEVVLSEAVKPEQKSRTEALPLNQAGQQSHEDLKIQKSLDQPPELTLQEKLNRTQKNTQLRLWPPNGEYRGPVVIDRPLSLDGQGATIWAFTGPVLSIQSAGVKLHNLRIEVTGEPTNRHLQKQCAISVKSERNLQSYNVEVRGLVMGLPEEEGEWKYPKSLRLGQLSYGKEHDLLLRLIVPVECRIASSIHGLTLKPHRLNPGRNEIQLHLDRLPEDTLLNGSIFLVTASLKRRITITAYIANSQESSIVSEENLVVWESEDWSNFSSTQESDNSFTNSVTVEPPKITKESKQTQTSLIVDSKSSQEQSFISSSAIYRGEQPNEAIFKPTSNSRESSQQNIDLPDEVEAQKISKIFQTQPDNRSQPSVDEPVKDSNQKDKIGKAFLSSEDRDLVTEDKVEAKQESSRLSSFLPHQDSQSKSLLSNQEISAVNDLSNTERVQKDLLRDRKILDNPLFKQESTTDRLVNDEQNKAETSSNEVHSRIINPLFGRSLVTDPSSEESNKSNENNPFW